MKGIQRTGGDSINTLGLAEETVHLVHLVYPSFRPALFFNHRLDFLAERLNEFRISEKTAQHLRGRLLTGNVQDCIIGRRRNVITCHRRREYACEIDKEQSPCQAVERHPHFLGLAHEQHEHIVLRISL